MNTDACTALSQRFSALNRVLEKNCHFWQLRPFTLQSLPWQAQYPALCRWLDRLDADTIAQLEGDFPALCDALSPFIADAAQLAKLCKSTCNAPVNDDYPAYLSNRIPGRKWQQITAFGAALPIVNTPVLEWCSGKGHLGRLLAYSGNRHIDSVEINPDLCLAGEKRAAQLNLPMRFHNVDVLTQDCDSLFQVEQQAVALHACGHLHTTLLRKAVARGTQDIAISPCCYHLIPEPVYQPLSAAASASSLRLDRQDLQLPLQETVTAGQRERKQRRTELNWRLGFDLLQRTLRQSDSYLPVPNLRKSLLQTDFKTFCHWAAEQKALTLPAGVDYGDYERRGQQRSDTVDRIELVRHLFRRPLEYWLVLDRALYLEEHEYCVSLVRFCDKSLTPRNLLLQGRRESTTDAPT